MRKIINNNLYKIIYQKIYDFLYFNPNNKTLAKLGIDRDHKFLLNLWNTNPDKMIQLVIIYHYTRHGDLVVEPISGYKILYEGYIGFNKIMTRLDESYKEQLVLIKKLYKLNGYECRSKK